MSSSKKPKTSKAEDKTAPEDQAETPEIETNDASQDTADDGTATSDDVGDPSGDEAAEVDGVAVDAQDDETDTSDPTASEEASDVADQDDRAENDQDDVSLDEADIADPEPTSVSQETTAAAAPLPVVNEDKKKRGGGFVPMLLGGAAAAAIGFGAARYDSGNWPFGGDDSFRSDVTAALDAQAQELVGFKSQLDTAVSDTTASLDGLRADLSKTSGSLVETGQNVDAATDRVAALEYLPDALKSLDGRLTDLAKKPIADTVSREAIKAYEDELERLRATMEEQRKAIEETIAAEKAKMEKIAEEATQMEERALSEARLAAARSAMTRVLGAIETGDSFAVALTELGENIDDPIPEALSAVAETGVATQAALRERFPDDARAALRSAREAGASDADGGNGGGIGGILDKMFEVRSTEPREGNDADAVLSRAEAAVRRGDLAAALTEIEALPDVAKGILEPWVNDATARLNALSAAQDIAQQLNQT